jgi:hypothetical protein
MTKPFFGIAACTAIALGLSTRPGPAAPALPDKPPRWEYAELSQRTTVRGFGPREGKENEAPAPRIAEPTLRWVTGDADVEAQGWDDLATKLKMSSAKKAATPAGRKVQVLNYLGSDGWELVGVNGGTTPTAASIWTFKRRVP